MVWKNVSAASFFSLRSLFLKPKYRTNALKWLISWRIEPLVPPGNIFFSYYPILLYSYLIVLLSCYIDIERLPVSPCWCIFALRVTFNCAEQFIKPCFFRMSKHRGVLHNCHPILSLYGELYAFCRLSSLHTFQEGRKGHQQVTNVVLSITSVMTNEAYEVNRGPKTLNPKP